MILYINSSIRNNSRTNKLALALLNKLGDYKEVKLDDLNLKPLNEKTLNFRTNLINNKDYNNSIFDLAKQFADADTIVICAPYYDGSFPSLLKLYLENIYITGIISKYSDKGIPIGLCKASKLYYVTTAGGRYNPSFSYEYIKDLSVNMFGIKDTKLIYAENLDIIGNNPEEILNKAIKEIQL